MQTSGNMEVFLILGAVFVGVGVYLFIYSRKRRALMREFARYLGFAYTPVGSADLEDRINKTIGYDKPGIVRAFSTLKDVIEGNGITMFRSTELLDLNPYGKSQNTHFRRIATYCDVPVQSDIYILLLKEGGVQNRHPESSSPEGDPAFEKVRGSLQENILPHPLSVTLRRGKALLYFEPVFKTETMDDLELLLELTEELRKVLS